MGKGWSELKNEYDDYNRNLNFNGLQSDDLGGILSIPGVNITKNLPAPMVDDYVPQEPKPINPVVKDYLLKKRGPASEPAPEILAAPKGPSELDKYNSQYGDEAYAKAKAEAEDKKSGLGWAHFAAGLGDAIAGRDQSRTHENFANIRKGIDDSTVGEFNRRKEGYTKELGTKKALESNDPNSEKSIAFRKAIEANFPAVAKQYGSAWANVTADDQENIFKPLQLKEQIEARKQVAQIAFQNKKEEKNEKKKTLLNEVEDRRQNILDNLDKLDYMIGEDGTYEVFGSHNQDMERLVEQIATDMAKLQDPNSVARPSEVEAVKRNLIRSGFQNTNSTAQDIIKNFRGEVEKRANTAYKVRGIELPQVPRENQNINQGDDASLRRQARIAELKAKAGK